MRLIWLLSYFYYYLLIRILYVVVLFSFPVVKKHCDTRLFFIVIEAQLKSFKLYQILFVSDSRVFLSVVLFSLVLFASRRNRCLYEIK